MPKRKEPSTLLKLSLGGVGALSLNFARRVSTESFLVSNNVGDIEGGIAQNAERRAAQMVLGNIDSFRQFLLECTPRELQHAVWDAVTESISDFVRNSKVFKRKASGNASRKSVHELQVVVKFIKLIAHDRLTKLDLTKFPKTLRDELMTSLGQMTGLRMLNLGSSCSEIWRKNMQLPLRYLTKLTSVTLCNDCQDDTLAILGQNCPDLQHLDIAGSSSVTDSGATWLLRLKKLTELDLYQTSISVAMYAQILMDLPILRSVGRCDQIGQVLDYINFHNSSQVILPLQHFHSRSMTNDQLKLLNDLCPNIKSVEFCIDNDVGSVNDGFRNLQNLEELKLLGCGFYTDEVDKLIVQRGPGLKLLNLEHVDELDMEALACVAKNCSNLEKLVLFSCDFSENFGSSLRERVFPPGTLKRLHTLVCVSETAPNVIEFLLRLATNVESVQFGSTAWVDDAVIARLLEEHGVLKSVQDIRILSSYELTMSSVELLLERCPELRVLSEIWGWRGVSQEELEEFRLRIKEQNLDLDTVSSWNVTTK